MPVYFGLPDDLASREVREELADDAEARQVAQIGVVMSEDAAWTTPLDAGYLECLPKAGLRLSI